MIQRMLARLMPVILVALVIVSVISAVAASNTVPTTRLTNQSLSITMSQLVPPACAGLNLTAIVVCPNNGNDCDGTSSNELILGDPGTKNISGGGGSDCIVASTAASTNCHRVSGMEIFINCGKVV
jgi:hypothetical protein